MDWTAYDMTTIPETEVEEVELKESYEDDNKLALVEHDIASCEKTDNDKQEEIAGSLFFIVATLLFIYFKKK